ncbi:polyketide cyclase/dehydrase [Gordonia araii NBRC 100433]|uniref:Polyketide cyclase/dehydrase n=1 Tax=Gordonia araii NBRC 100433 TaxID=1073574 RepID=G7GYH6_9ACTN|nr:SRPBCC family protein [Gordonia araii]NNG97352.1 SRPBCC family protein [Gordonia araii NBRC 100433]GAB08651.1 polyketide cyclase/dehydrase [Gordonia araii NBRC 100433]
MSRFELRRTLDCTPEVAWRLVTDPEQMRRWSTARVDLLDAGPGERPDTAGALRVITLPDGKRKLREVVEHAAPSREFRYRVYDGGPLLLSHQGVQTFTPTIDGRTELAWQVSMRLVAPPLSAVLCRVIRKQVGESLDLLADIAPGAEFDDPLPTTSPLAKDFAPGTPEFDQLLADAGSSLTVQRALADELAAAGDPKQWFARVYQYVTEEMIAAATGESPLGLDHPDWVLALIPAFHDYYERNLTAYRAGSDVEPAWVKAWSTAESQDPKRPHVPVMKGLLYGVSAHIDADLPRALAEVHRTHYPERDLREFRPDYLRLAPVFTAASDRLLADLPRSHKPWWTPLASRIHPQFRDSMLGRVGYDVGRHRVKTFAKAVEATRESTHADAGTVPTLRQAQ